jgi:hypothetical protein
MRFFTWSVILWWVLLFACWPLALAALALFPLLWLLWFVVLPFRVLSVLVEAVLAFLRALLFLPARLLGEGRSDGRRL